MQTGDQVQTDLFSTFIQYKVHEDQVDLLGFLEFFMKVIGSYRSFEDVVSTKGITDLLVEFGIIVNN